MVVPGVFVVIAGNVKSRYGGMVAYLLRVKLMIQGVACGERFAQNGVHLNLSRYWFLEAVNRSYACDYGHHCDFETNQRIPFTFDQTHV